jgi:hypothetical protein
MDPEVQAPPERQNGKTSNCKHWERNLEASFLDWKIPQVRVAIFNEGESSLPRYAAVIVIQELPVEYRRNRSTKSKWNVAQSNLEIV